MIMDIETEKFFIRPVWPAPSCINAYTTLRQAENPTALLTLPSEPIWLKQTHSTIALEAIDAHREQEADAAYTDKPYRVCAIKTADCLPILVCNRQGTTVSAIHAGWRGLVNGIIENTLHKLNLPAEDILVWLGPAIGPTCFEVRKDVYDAFTEHDKEASAAFQQINDEQWLANLYMLARLRLARLGITNVYGAEYCTFSDQDRFFSYRRDGKTTGRIVSFIWIGDSPANL